MIIDIPRILVVLPVYEGMKPGPLLGVCGIHRHLERASLENQYKSNTVIVGPRSAIRDARNEAVLAALHKGASHIYFQDDDIIAPPDIVTRLLSAAKPVIGALVYRKDGVPCVFKGHVGNETVWLDHPEKEIFSCSAVGTGAMLIEAETFAELDGDPWFYYERDSRSMDVNFCRDVRRAGISVWCDPDIKVGQLGDQKVVYPKKFTDECADMHIGE